MASSMIDYLKIILTVQLFYALGVTILVYSLPTSQLSYVTLYEGPTQDYSFESMGLNVESGAASQLTLPLIDMATLVGYTGNIAVDLVFNFATAVPQMFTLLIQSFLIFFNVESYIATYIKLFFFGIISILYVVGTISFLMNIRSSGGIIT